MLKKKNTPGIRRFSPLIIIAAVLASLLLVVLLLFGNLIKDAKRLYFEEYDSVFLSMYPIDTYSEEDYTYWREMDTVIASYNFSDIFTLKAYLKLIQLSENPVHTVYLGVLPTEINGEELASLLLGYPHIDFHVIPAYPSMKYWTSLSEAEYEQEIQAYRDFIPPMVIHANVATLFFSSSEWLIANPDNYVDSFLTTEDISQTIMLHSDRQHTYKLTAEMGQAPMDEMKALIDRERNTPTDYPNLVGETIVLFGDSVIGNYTNNTSIPNVVGALTGADAYNLGYGGTPATREQDPEAYSLPEILEAFLNKDPTLLPADSQAHAGLTQYLAAGTDAPSCFVINYGLNDYFSGKPISSDDPYDTYTFCGALRYSIDALRTEYPHARIILATPNFTIYYNGGTDYMSEHNHMLSDYVDAVISVAEEMNVDLIDNFNDLDITLENFPELLADGCHPNEAGRFLMGERIVMKLRK